MEETTQPHQKTNPETADQLIRQVKRRTRRRFTAEEKIRILIEAMKREIPVTELCRREGVPTAVYYSWLKDFMEAGKSRLQGDTLREANRSEVQRLKRENEQLKELLGEKDLELYVYKKSLTE